VPDVAVLAVDERGGNVKGDQDYRKYFRYVHNFSSKWDVVFIENIR
jgi:hypothetical protein